MAEAVARKVAEERGLKGIEVRSAGTGAFPGRPASDYAERVAERHDLDLSSHRSTPLSADLVAWADLILTMGSGHLRRVLELGGEGKSHLLGAYATDADRAEDGGAELEVPDPFGGNDETYERTLETLEEYVRAVLQKRSFEGGEGSCPE